MNVFRSQIGFQYYTLWNWFYLCWSFNKHYVFYKSDCFIFRRRPLIPLLWIRFANISSLLHKQPDPEQLNVGLPNTCFRAGIEAAIPSAAVDSSATA